MNDLFDLGVAWIEDGDRAPGYPGSVAPEEWLWPLALDAGQPGMQYIIELACPA